MAADARERLRAALERYDLDDDAHGALARAARALLAEPPPAGDAALLREFRNWWLHDMVAEESAHMMFRRVQSKLDELLARAATPASVGDAALLRELRDMVESCVMVMRTHAVGHRTTEAAEALLARAAKGAPAAAEPEPARPPDGHIYRYRSPFGGLHESLRPGHHNGAPPFEVVPYWLDRAALGRSS